MSKSFALRGIVLLTAAGLSLFGQDEKAYSQWMKDIAAANGQARKALEAKTSKQDVADAGQKLVALFTQVEAFWTQKGAADAIAASKAALAASRELADPKGIGPAQAELGKLNEQCKTCHAAHREKADGGFKIK
ncbi:MAG TPA: hypothetical protein VL285_24675 [Bryobacteraceae bacterium]|nr:hypothetical protein [Bryobacteraceae bacterium]